MVDVRSKNSPFFAKKNYERFSRQRMTKQYIFADVSGEAYTQSRFETTDYVGSGLNQSGERLTGRVLEFSVWVRPDNNSNHKGIWSFGAATLLRRLTNRTLRFRITDNSGTRIAEISSNQTVPEASWTHIYGFYDNRGTGAYGMYVNGVEGTYNEVVGPIYNGKTINVNRDFQVLASPLDGNYTGGIADLFVNIGNEDPLGRSAFIDGSDNPKDPRNLPVSPLIMLGSVMSESDWNNGIQLGQLAYRVDAGSVSPV